jgi:hypothetical protein
VHKRINDKAYALWPLVLIHATVLYKTPDRKRHLETGKSQCLANPSVSLMRNRGSVEFETLEKTVLVISKEYLDSNKLFFYKRFVHNLPIFLIGKIWLNIGICQTLGFSILKMWPRNSYACLNKGNAISGFLRARIFL